MASSIFFLAASNESITSRAGASPVLRSFPPSRSFFSRKRAAIALGLVLPNLPISILISAASSSSERRDAHDSQFLSLISGINDSNERGSNISLPSGPRLGSDGSAPDGTLYVGRYILMNILSLDGPSSVGGKFFVGPMYSQRPPGPPGFGSNFQFFGFASSFLRRSARCSSRITSSLSTASSKAGVASSLPLSCLRRAFLSIASVQPLTIFSSGVGSPSGVDSASGGDGAAPRALSMAMNFLNASASLSTTSFSAGSLRCTSIESRSSSVSKPSA